MDGRNLWRHVIATGSGWGCKPSGYYLSLRRMAICSFMFQSRMKRINEMGTLLATEKHQVLQLPVAQH